MLEIDWGGFDVPKKRKEDWGWLNRNFLISSTNREHLRFEDVWRQIRINYKQWQKDVMCVDD